MKCDFCKLEAVVNYQRVWTRFEINKNGSYKEDSAFDGIDFEEPVEENNVHLCKKHEDEWIKGKI